MLIPLDQLHEWLPAFEFVHVFREIDTVDELASTHRPERKVDHGRPTEPTLADLLIWYPFIIVEGHSSWPVQWSQQSMEFLDGTGAQEKVALYTTGSTFIKRRLRQAAEDRWIAHIQQIVNDNIIRGHRARHMLIHAYESDYYVYGFGQALWLYMFQQYMLTCPDQAYNDIWLRSSRPLFEAFMHAWCMYWSMSPNVCEWRQPVGEAAVQPDEITLKSDIKVFQELQKRVRTTMTHNSHEENKKLIPCVTLVQLAMEISFSDPHWVDVPRCDWYKPIIRPSNDWVAQVCACFK